MNRPSDEMMEYARSWQPRKIDERHQFAKPLERGWLLPYLLQLESMAWGRWQHWCECMEANRVVGDAIPQCDFMGGGRGTTGWRVIEKSLECINRGGGWQGWGSWQVFEYLLDWLLFGFGSPLVTTAPTDIGPDGHASNRLYQVFDLAPLLAQPYDYLGDMMAENAFGRGNGFFPTPMDVCAMMVTMQMHDKDMRAKTVCDPCLGTGRMLLAASNYSYRLYGNDINLTVIKAAMVNAYLYAPWMAKPFPFWNDSERVEEKTVQEYAAAEVITKVLQDTRGEKPMQHSGKTEQLTLI